MKKIIALVLSAVIILFSTCKKDEIDYVTSDELNSAIDDVTILNDSIANLLDSLKYVGGIINYSVQVVNASDGSFVNTKSTEGSVSGAIVTISQHGITKSDTTGVSGIAAFEDLRVGTINVNIKAQNFTEVNMVTMLNPENDADVLSFYNILRYIATMVPVFSTTESLATINGITSYESDLTNAAPELAESVEIIGIIDVDDSFFIDNYFYDPYGNVPDLYYGEITQIAFSSLVSTATSNTLGVFSLQVPSTPDGLPIKLEVSEMAVDQQLLMNTMYDEDVFGVQTIRTIFSSDLQAGGPVAPSSIHSVNSAYVLFSSPTGTVNNQPDVQATAEAQISESGIVSINIIDQGDGYTQAPIVEITGDGEGAEATAFITSGKVTSIVIDNQGKGYTSANVNMIDKEGDDASATAVVTYSVTDFTVNNSGAGYLTAPTVQINTSSGSGASGTALMSGYVHEIEVSFQGSNYTSIPEIIIAGSSGTDATATADMTDFNPLHSLELTENFTTAYETAPDVDIFMVSHGSGATALAQLTSAGEVSRIELTNAGLGYDIAPTVLISGGGGTGAIADATLNGDGSINVEVLEGGYGYTSNPTVQISAPPVGGVQATGNAVRAFEIESIVLTNPGSGYDVEPNVEIDGVNLDHDGFGNDDIFVRLNMGVEAIFVNTQGNGYSSTPTVEIIAIDGNGSAASATAEIRYLVEDIEIVTVGSGYTWDTDVSVIIDPPADENGTQADFSIVFGDGVLSEVILDMGGTGYTAPPNVTINGGSPDEDAEVEATVSFGSVNGFSIISPGSGFAWTNPVNITINITTQIIAADASADANPESGQISFIEVTNPGQGYTTAPVVEFENEDAFGNPVSGSGAVADVNLVDGRVASITVTNPGTGYFYAPVVNLVVPAYNQIAEGTPVINAAGNITSITITINGQGYISEPTITFTPSVPGMGQNASAEAIIQNGQVTGIIMTNQGNGYLGKNSPSTAKNFVITPTGSAGGTFNVIASKTYIKDIYLGTGKRTIED